MWDRLERAKTASRTNRNPAPAAPPSVMNLRRPTDEHLDDQMAATIEDTADDPETVVYTRDRNTIVHKCLKQLSPAHREVIDLVYYHEKSVDEVAKIVGVPP